MRPNPVDSALFDEVKAALRARLDTVAPQLGYTGPSDVATGRLLHELSVLARASPDASLSWLLFVAVAAVFPTPSEFIQFRRRLDLSTDSSAIVAVLVATLDAAAIPSVVARKLTLVTDSTVVDVNFCARNEHNTGIQRVVRSTLPHWRAEGREMTLVAWMQDASAMRAITQREEDRVFNWGHRVFDPRHPVPEPTDGLGTLVVPWRSRMILPEVPADMICSRLACLAEFSGNDVSLIGYDAIPLVTAESQPNEESERFAHYLAIVKHSTLVAAISESAAEEFRGFRDTLPAQGLVGPSVVAVPLALEVAAAKTAASDENGEELPLVLCVGSHEPRKNQEAVLYAGEALFEEGKRFELVFLGGGSAATFQRFDQRAKSLSSRGFAVRCLRRATDAELVDLYRRARFTVFVSLHEGYGLPVAESLALGTPVLTSDFGSLADIAKEGGCLTVDPRDDLAVLGGFRTMLEDDELVERLAAEARAIPPRGWEQYSTELWDSMVSGGVA